VSCSFASGDAHGLGMCAFQRHDSCAGLHTMLSPLDVLIRMRGREYTQGDIATGI
jgi:hypothetical protein